MSGEKRAGDFGSTQLVKRQRSDADLNGGALTRTNGAGGGALVHGVSLTPTNPSPSKAELKRHCGRPRQKTDER